MEGSLTEKNLKNEDGFFFGSFAALGERYVGEGCLSEAPSRLSGLRAPSGKQNDRGDPVNEDAGGEVASV